MKRLLLVSRVATVAFLTLAAGSALAQQTAPRDGFYRLGQINKASIVMLAETGIVPEPLAAAIAKGIAQVIAIEGQPGARRSSDYLVFEAKLLEVAGPKASRLHTGRSRQDIGSTSTRITEREALLDTYASMLEPRRRLLDLAERHLETIIPAYTHGVQAQPTSLAHYLLAFASALDRDAARLQAAYARINLSPLGAAALGTSGFPLDRPRLAALLGFDGLVVNSYDANHVSSAETKTEFAGVLAMSAVHIGQLVEDLHIQYHDPVPWFLLDPSLTGVSSIMPQKRNPIAIEQLRRIASSVVGDAQTVFTIAHNTSTGMLDYRGAGQLLETAEGARSMYRLLGQVVGGLIVKPDRSLAELEADYATMTEVADTLLRHAEVPFRIGHHYASELTTYGREHEKKPMDLTDAELSRIYEDATGGEILPVSVAQIREALDPTRMVMTRRGQGGPQPDETRRMLGHHRQNLAANTAWLSSARGRVQEARETLERAFGALVSAAP